MNRKRTIRLGPAVRAALLLWPLALLPGCTEFMEESLEKATVAPLSPGDRAQLGNYTVTFRWEPTPYALSYQLQVATPDFLGAGSFLADTVVEGLKFSLSLPPGSYRWRLRAQNGSSQSAYTYRSFTLHEGALSNQQVLLNSPAAHWLTNRATVTLGWEPLYAATRYRLQVDTAHFRDGENMPVDETLSATAHTLVLARDGNYQWRVMAANDTAASAWSEVRHFTLDTSPPGRPVPRSPADGAIMPLPVQLGWEPVADADHYLLHAFGQDGQTPIGSGYPVRVQGTGHAFATGLEPGTKVVWQLRAVDGAGNQGELSEARSFTVGF